MTEILLKADPALIKAINRLADAMEKQVVMTVDIPPGAAPKTEPKKAKEKPAETPEVEPDEITSEDLKAALMGLSKRRGREISKEVIAEFGASILPDVKEKDWPALMARIDEEMQAEAA